MEDQYFQIPVKKVIELVLTEERAKIRKHYLDALGKPTADVMDSYIPTESDVLKMFDKI